MVDHLSPLTLDELAAGLGGPAPHLEGCAECRARLEQVKLARASVLESPRFAAGLQRLGAPRRSHLPSWAPPVIGIALAASLLFVVGGSFLSSVSDGSRLKGAPSVELLDSTGTPVTRAKVGQRLRLAAGGAGRTQVLIASVDEKGAVGLLSDSVPLTPGARVPLNAFEVTAGAVRVIACFADQKLEATQVRAAITREVVKVSAARQSPLEVGMPPLEIGTCVGLRLEVEK